MEGSRNNHDSSSPGVWGRKPPCNHFLGRRAYSKQSPAKPPHRAVHLRPTQGNSRYFETSKNILERKKILERFFLMPKVYADAFNSLREDYTARPPLQLGGAAAAFARGARSPGGGATQTRRPHNA